jgi:hypothetical protein
MLFQRGSSREDVCYQAQARFDRIDIRAACDELLEDVVLNGSGELVATDALLVGQCDVHGEQDRRRGVDRHRRRNPTQVDSIE